MIPGDNQYIYIFSISLLANIIFGIFILYYHRERKRIYKILNDVNRSISEKNQAITEQAAKLSDAYENLWKVNHRLEEEVRLRTDKITIHQQKLIEHIRFYTHKLRGTMASMMGVLLLVQNEDMSKSLDELIDLMNACVRQMDEIIREFVHRVEEDN